MDITVTGGADELARLGKRFKDAANGGLKRELSKGIRTATKPLIADVRKAARDLLPSRGGLAERVAESKISTRTTTTGNNVGVRIIGRSGYDLKKIDQGKLRHPVFGGKTWIEQDVEPGFWTETLTDGAPKVRREVAEAIERVARRIT